MLSEKRLTEPVRTAAMTFKSVRSKFVASDRTDPICLDSSCDLAVGLTNDMALSTVYLQASVTESTFDLDAMAPQRVSANRSSLDTLHNGTPAGGSSEICPVDFPFVNSGAMPN